MQKQKKTKIKLKIDFENNLKKQLYIEYNKKTKKNFLHALIAQLVRALVL
jgi:hypothetical protein